MKGKPTCTTPSATYSFTQWTLTPSLRKLPIHPTSVTAPGLLCQFADSKLVRSVKACLPRRQLFHRHPTTTTPTQTHKTSLQASHLPDRHTRPSRTRAPHSTIDLSTRPKPQTLYILPSPISPTMRAWAFWCLTVSTWLILFIIMTSLCQHECRRNNFLAGGPNILWLRCLVYCNTISLAFATMSVVGLGGGMVVAAARSVAIR